MGMRRAVVGHGERSAEADHREPEAASRADAHVAPVNPFSGVITRTIVGGGRGLVTRMQTEPAGT
jgi:hypothetical protein